MPIPLSNAHHEPMALTWGVEVLPQTLGPLPPGGACGSRQDHTSEVLQFTREIFPGSVTIFERDDPEIPNHCYLLFQVTSCGTIESLAAQNDEWHRRLCQLPGRIPGRYRLSILPR